MRQTHKAGEKIFNDKWNPIFLNPESVCMWILIVDGRPIMRSESIHMMSDEDVKMLSNDGCEKWTEQEIAQKELLDGIDKIIKEEDGKEEI